MHPRDSNIFFVENTHKYIVKGVKNVVSVTEFIKKFFTPFNASEVITKMKRRPDFKDGKYGEMKDNEIENKWKNDGYTASKLGTVLHKTIENFYTSGVNPDTITTEFKHFLAFNESIKDIYKVYKVESSIYMDPLVNSKNETVCIAGQIDCLFVNSENEFILADWKRSKEIKAYNMYGRGIGPLSHLDDCNWNRYSLQLNLYAHILKTYYDMKIVKMILVVLHEDNETYKVLDVSDMTKEIDDMLGTLKSC